METIEQLQPAEIEEFCRAHIAMQAVTYAGIASGDFTGQLWHSYQERVEHLHRGLADAEPGAVDLVARSGRGGVVGLAQVRRGVEEWELEAFGDDHVVPAAEHVLKSLFIMPSEQGTGLARRLLERALPKAQPAYLWVMTQNERAIRFYQRHGFAPDGVSGISHGWGEMPMQRMVRR